MYMSVPLEQNLSSSGVEVVEVEDGLEVEIDEAEVVVVA